MPSETKKAFRVQTRYNLRIISFLSELTLETEEEQGSQQVKRETAGTDCNGVTGKRFSARIFLF